MRSLVLGSAALAAVILAGCKGGSTISCNTNDDCIQGGIPGVCEPSPTSDTHWCTFTDATCPGGRRWGAAAGDDLASTCLGAVDAGVPDASPDTGPDADLTDAGPEPDAATISTRLFVADTGQSIYVFDGATLESLGTVTVPPLGYYNGGVQVAHGSAWMGRYNQAGTDSQLVAMDPATSIVRAGYPKEMPVCAGAVGEAGMYCFVGSAFKLLAIQDFSTTLRTFQGETATSRFFDLSDDGVLLVVYDKAVHQLDPQLTEIGTEITYATTPYFVKSSVALNRIAITNDHGVDLYDLTTHAHVGLRKTYTDIVTGVVFDGEKLVVILNGGSVGALSAVDASEVVAPVMRAGNHLRHPYWDRTRNRIIAGTENSVIVLDASTLQHVTGSPISVSTPVASIRTF